MTNHNKSQLSELFRTATPKQSGRSSAWRNFRYTALVGLITWFAMQGAEIRGTPYTLPALSDWVNGYPYQIKKKLQVDENNAEIQKLRREYAEFSKNHLQSKQTPIYHGGAGRKSSRSAISFIVTLIITGFTYYILSKFKKNRGLGLDPQPDRIDISKIRRK